MNRGVAKRPLFEDAADARFFLSKVATEVRRGRLEVHAYCLMTTHYHMLVRSPMGELSEAMRRAQNEHSRRFNRRHKRDGTLIRGRYYSKVVQTLLYRRNVVRYIDANPVRAGLVRSARAYPLCSRSDYAQSAGPIWLTRDWIEAQAASAAEQPTYSASCYARAFGGELSPLLEELVTARMASTATDDPLDDLIGSAPARVQAWMRRKAKLADGCAVGLPVCGRLGLLVALEADAAENGPWVVSDAERLRDGVPLSRVGLLRDLCGWSIDAISQVEKGATGRVRRLIVHHRRLLLTDREYAARAASIAKSAIERCAGTPGAGRSRAVRIGR